MNEFFALRGDIINFNNFCLMKLIFEKKILLLVLCTLLLMTLSRSTELEKYDLEDQDVRR